MNDHVVQVDSVYLNKKRSQLQRLSTNTNHTTQHQFKRNKSQTINAALTMHT